MAGAFDYLLTPRPLATVAPANVGPPPRRVLSIKQITPPAAGAGAGDAAAPLRPPVADAAPVPTPAPAGRPPILTKLGDIAAGVAGTPGHLDPLKAFAYGLSGARNAASTRSAAELAAKTAAEDRAYSREQDKLKFGLETRKVDLDEEKIKQTNAIIDTSGDLTEKGYAIIARLVRDAGMDPQEAHDQVVKWATDNPDQATNLDAAGAGDGSGDTPDQPGWFDRVFNAITGGGSENDTNPPPDAPNPGAQPEPPPTIRNQITPEWKYSPSRKQWLSPQGIIYDANGNVVAQ